LSDNGYEDEDECDGDGDYDGDGGGGADWPNGDRRVRARVPAGTTSSYYVDGVAADGDSGGTGTLDGPGKAAAMFGESSDLLSSSDDNGHDSSEEPDLEPVIRVGSVAQRTVASSIVRDYSPTLRHPHFSHTSIPADIDHTALPMGFPMRTKHRSLGRMTPSSMASGVGTVGALLESSEDEKAGNGGNEYFTSNGDGTGVGQQAHSSAKDSIIRVMYDSESSCHSPDLFARPLHIGSPVKRNPDSPVNTLATPPPLIGITAATSPTTSQEASPTSEGVPSSFGSDENDHSHPGMPNQSTVGHTGASTPEEDITPGVATISCGNVGSLDYDAYTEERYGPKGVSTAHTGTPGGNSSIQHPNEPPVEFNGYSTETFAALSSHDDSEPQMVMRPPLTLYQEYVQSNHSQPESSVADLIRASAQISSRSLMRSEEVLGTPASAPSYTRIIGDLEEMLNHALEIAGRAVQDSHSALNQRDESIRSAQGSTRGSFLSVLEGTDRAVTAPESLYLSEENHRLAEHASQQVPEQGLRQESDQLREQIRDSPRESTSESTQGSIQDSVRGLTEEAMKESREPVPAQVPMQVLEEVSGEISSEHSEGRPTCPSIKIIEQDANIRSTSAVYSDNGERSSQSTLDRNGKRRSKQRHPRSPIPFIDIHESERERVWDSNWQKTSPSEIVSTRATKAYSRGGSITRASVPAGPEQKFRMEVGENGEIILVRLPRSEPSLGPRPSNTEGEVVQRPRRYKGGWEWNIWSKRFTASVACGVVGLTGWIVGSY